MFLETHNKIAAALKKGIENHDKALQLAAEARRLGDLDLRLKATLMVSSTLENLAELQQSLIDYNHGLCEALDQKLLEQ